MTTTRDDAYTTQLHDGSDLSEEENYSDFDPSVDRYYARRNILIYNREGSIIAGLQQRGYYTIINVYNWLAILFHLPQSENWFIHFRSEGRPVLPQTDSPFPVGSFHLVDQAQYILSPVPKSTFYRYRCLVNDNRKSTRTDDELFHKVAVRDKKCLITGMECMIYPKELGVFSSIVCAKIFPFVAPSEWSNSDVQEIFGGLAESHESLTQAMISPSNAFVCAYMASEAFNHHWYSIDVDDDYRIVQFLPCDQWHLPADSKLLIDSWQETNSRPSDALLRAHFHQALIRWGLHDPQAHREYIIASKLAFNIQNCEAPSDHLCWAREPGKTVLEAYVAQQLLGYCEELGDAPRDLNLDLFEPVARNVTEHSPALYFPPGMWTGTQRERSQADQVDSDVDSDVESDLEPTVHGNKMIWDWTVREDLIPHFTDPDLIPALDFWLVGSS
ncbi:hypothetical protein SISSUDRAFT_1131433 [Sistotremastrum suecicum HHB10207 ss-3]|uniref:HNH nuclease domain-containing protein n=1 Tax=Sistotremastrum suecicum HHB10207 ss-3 TaxID=1314776 RepID=A0A166A6M2_9AGAM|nr:hypothetical protein SISSUDRAFT_1131433 [Sistotremastrum suecicum HHB10207 ss-3]